MRFLGWRHPTVKPTYAVHPSYAAARRAFLELNPPDPDAAPPSRRVWAVAVDVALETGVVTVYGRADGTTSIHSTSGTHTTGIGRVPAVAAATAELLRVVEEVLPLLAPATSDEAALPANGFTAIRARTLARDLIATTRRAGTGGRGPLVAVSSAAETVLRVANDAIVDGFVEADTAEDAGYEIGAAYRTMRRTMLSITPEVQPTPELPRVAAAVVEFGLEHVAVSLFVVADGTGSVERSDGSLAVGLGSAEAVRRAVLGLLRAIEASLDPFERSTAFPLPAHGHVQVIARLFPGSDPRGPFVRTSVPGDLADGHALADAIAQARAIVQMAGVQPS